MLPSRILQMRPGLLTTHRDKRGQGFIIGGVQTRFVVPRVHLLHKFVGQALRICLVLRSLGLKSEMFCRPLHHFDSPALFLLRRATDVKALKRNIHFR
jgi:hypothetical protein